jgi:hypothetical protein
MKLAFATTFAAALVAITLGSTTVAAQDQHIILHPNGFGEHSYASWKAQQGLTDSSGAKNQALYFQKMTTTVTFAAGLAVFKGIEGLPTSQLTGLSFWVRDDGHCGAGAPRFNIRVRPTVGGPSQTIFIGCAGMVPGGMMTAPNGHVFRQRSFPAPAAFLPGIVTSLAIVFDEGDDQGTGFVHLDDITVEIEGEPHVWTSASDNGSE